MRTAVPSELAGDLGKIVGADNVRHQERDLLLFSYDASPETIRPEAVVFPRTTEETSAVVRLARERQVPVTPRGGATSLSGGPVAADGGIVVSLTKMDRVLELDLPNQRAVVQPGCICMDLQSAVEQRGFFYAPDPASQIVCTLGGNVAENAGGPHCLKYGVTTNHVTGLEMVLPDGRVLRTGGKSLDRPGPDLTGAVVGSEGTFGIVTEITCRLLPKPQTVTTMLAIFDSLDKASQAVSGIIGAGLLPATLEMMDKHVIYAVQQSFDAGYPPDAEVVLIIEVDGLQVAMDRQLAQIREICLRHGVQDFKWAKDDAERALLWRGRKGAFSSLANLSPSQIVSDVAVPRTELPYVLHGVMEIAAKYGVQIGNVFHAGDGNLHPHILYDIRDPDQVQRAHQADEEIIKLAVSRGGVLTGEHGVGSCKRKSMPLLFSAASLRALWALKDVFDPAGLFNPRKVLPPRGGIEPAEDPHLPHGAFQEAAGRLVVTDEDGVLQPYDAEAVGKLLALAVREGKRVCVRGGGTKSHPPAADAAVLSTLGLKKILSLDPENMTVRVEAGVSWSRLEQAVAGVGQRVALRPPHARDATVGGVIATNSSGPHRLRHGTCRDLITGLRFVLPSGETIAMGGGCVKNVSGYALEKLLIDSGGALGVLVDATFRTLPLPEAERTLLLSAADGAGDREGLCALGQELIGGHLQCAAVELLSPGLAARGGAPEAWVLAVAAEGLVEEVDYLAREIGALAAGHGLQQVAVLEGDASIAFWEPVIAVGDPVAQLGVPLSLGPQAVERLAQTLGEQALIRLGSGTGILCVSVPGMQLGPLETLAGELEGSARWLAPAPDGQPRGHLDHVAAALCAQIKQAYDPQGVLAAPGWEPWNAS